MELAHLHRQRKQCFVKSLQSVNDGTIYFKTLISQLCNSLHISRYGFVGNIFVPQNLLANRIFYSQQTEVMAPVCGIHLDADLLVSGDLLDIPHIGQITTNCPGWNAILFGQLFKRLLAIYIVGDYLLLIPAITAIKLATTRLAFI